MELEKNYLKQIEQIVEKSAEKTKTDLRKEIQLSAEKTKNEFRKEIRETVGAAENKIIAVISREVSDLADINRAVIMKADELDYRLRICERRLGIKTH